jgi:hypothetical protein
MDIPRVNAPFVDSSGRLTLYGISVLNGFLAALGGPAAELTLNDVILLIRQQADQLASQPIPFQPDTYIPPNDAPPVYVPDNVVQQDGPIYSVDLSDIMRRLEALEQRP